MSEPETEPVEPTPEPDAVPDGAPEPPAEDEPTPDEANPDAEPPPPEQPPEQPPAPSASEIQLEKRRADAEKKWRDHEKRVRAIFEEEGQYLYDCPLCVGPTQGMVDVRFAGQVQPEIAEAVLGYMRGAEQVRYLPAQNVAECPVCSGYGKVLSGSKVAGKDLITCISCKGFGFVPPPTPGDNGRVDEALVPVGVGAEEGPLSTEDLDIWGSPHYLPDGQENGNYGKMPQYKDPRLP